MSKFHAPEPFDFSQPAQWPLWIQRFSRFRIATKLNKEDGEVQVNSLLYAMGEEAEGIFNTFTFTSPNNANDYDKVVDKFSEHFIPRRNFIHERACFHQRSQRPGESVEAFVRGLHELAEHCDFGPMKEDQIRDRIVIGIADWDVSQKLQMESSLTLDKAVQIALQSELIKAQNASVGTAADASAIHQQPKGAKHHSRGSYGEASMSSGYHQSPGGFGSPVTSQGADKKGRTRAQQIVPCTVSQLMSAAQAEDVFRVGDVEVAQVTIVGVIRSTDKSMTNIQYKVDDMTAAPMDVKQWVDTEDPGVDSTVIPPNTYVKVSGNLRSFQNNRSLVAFSVRPLEDMNEITSHMLEVVQAHMLLSKPQMGGGGGGMNSTIMPMSRPGMGGMSTSGGYSGANAMVNNGLSPNQNQVLCLIKSSPEPQGISIQELKQRLSGMSMTVIRQVVDFLSNEGHIFSTIDEDHFRSTDQEA